MNDQEEELREERRSSDPKRRARAKLKTELRKRKKKKGEAA